MQTKKESFTESYVNTFIGFIISLILVYTVLPYYGIEKSFNVSLEITLIFTLVSVSRNYVIRRIFNNKIKINWERITIGFYIILISGVLLAISQAENWTKNFVN